MKKLEMIYEGKAKKVYRTDNEKEYIVEYKDDATAFNGEKKGTIVNKGIVNNTMSAIIFKMLEKAGIKTHMIEQLSDRESLVKAVKILPIEVIVRNVAAGSLSKRLGIPEGVVLSMPSLEFSYKNDALGDPLINDDHAIILGLATRDELAAIRKTALDINDLLVRYFIGLGLKLIDFKIEFGLYDGEIILADEISPDTCRLWDIKTNEKLDKDRFRRDLGNVEEAYTEVLARVNKCAE
ncbi:MAG: phosphoribosylaminoimidazolesuccinocarboxamide synthase [Eubacteriales bacterium]